MLVIFFTFLYITVAILLVFIILLQAGRGGGIAAAFGGATVESIFGTRRMDIITKATVVLGALFMILSILLVRMGPTSLIKMKGAPKGERPGIVQPQESPAPQP